MKNLFTTSLFLFGLIASSLSAGCGQPQTQCPADAPTNECWCKYVHYEPQYYSVPRCVTETIPCKKTCCRYVDEQYEVERCRMVPQYYKETLCRKVPQYYQVDDSKTCQKTIYEKKCQYVPTYYWKKTCGNEGVSGSNNNGRNPAPVNTGCGR